MSELEVKVSKVISAPIEKVFDAWLDPKMLAKIMQPMEGMSDAIVTNDASVGGKFSIVMVAGEDKMPHSGEYLEIVRPNRLVFTWETDCSAEGSTVTLDFSKVDDENTQVDLHHVKFIDEETRDNHKGGWTGILDALGKTMLEESYSSDFLITVTPEVVFKAITKDIDKWWTVASNSASKVGDTLTVKFEEGTFWEMRVTKDIVNKYLVWHVTNGNHNLDDLSKKNEWIDTMIKWKIEKNGTGSKVSFIHKGLVPTLECYDTCNNGWDYFLTSLQSYLNRGEGNPYSKMNKPPSL